MAKLKPAPADKGPTRECPDCGTKNHVKRPKCKNEGCDHVFPKPEAKASKASSKSKPEHDNGLAVRDFILLDHGGDFDAAIKAVESYQPSPIAGLIESHSGKAENLLAAINELKARRTAKSKA